MGAQDHFCALAFPEHGSVTFRCDLAESLYKYGAGDYNKFADMFDAETFRVKAYYPILHTLKSFGSDFAFKDVDLATCASVRSVFNSFLHMSKEMNSWAEKGCVMIEDKKRIPVKALMARQKLSCLRIEVSFILKVPDKEELDTEEVMKAMETLLGRDVNLIFGHGGGTAKNVLIENLCFISTRDWLKHVMKVRAMILQGANGIEFRPPRFWRSVTCRGKHQAECLQSLLIYCCRKANGALRSRSWAEIWEDNAKKDYSGMSDIIY
jgi:hypothetical protein